MRGRQKKGKLFCNVHLNIYALVPNIHSNDSSRVWLLHLLSWEVKSVFNRICRISRYGGGLGVVQCVVFCSRFTCMLCVGFVCILHIMEQCLQCSLTGYVGCADEVQIPSPHLKPQCAGFVTTLALRHPQTRKDTHTYHRVTKTHFHSILPHRGSVGRKNKPEINMATRPE